MNTNVNAGANGSSVSLNDLPSLASAAMLGSLNISVWEGRKKDKATEQEVQESKGARSSRAASVHKHLFAESPALESIKTLRGEARQWFNKNTLVWDDNSNRIITAAQYFELMQDAANFQKRFEDLVNIFLNIYPQEISRQAFELGAMFNRDEYPTVDELRTKFRFELNVAPMPQAGDIRLDIGKEALKELQLRCERDTQERLGRAMADAWDRVKSTVVHISERMNAVIEHDPNKTEEVKTVDEHGNVTKVEIIKKRRPKLHDSMLDNALELCSLMRDLNITNDPRLEEARQDLERALVRVDMDSLKKSPEMQSSLKTAMDNIVGKFAF